MEGVRGRKFKNVGNKPNSWTDREQSWHTYAYSSGNGYGLNMNPLIPGGMVLGGHQFINMGKLPNHWTDI